jgi:hypothetical protein
METISGTLTALDAEISNQSAKFYPFFVYKWSDHRHAQPSPYCNKTITFDGNWKVCRIKCAYDKIWTSTPEFGEIQMGCLETPCRGSYFCAKHADYKLSFEIDNEFIEFDPLTIQATQKSL